MAWGSTRVADPRYLSHYPGHPQDPTGRLAPQPRKPTNPAGTAFLALGPSAEAWLIEAAAAGVVQVRVKMTAAVELAALMDELDDQRREDDAGSWRTVDA